MIAETDTTRKIKTVPPTCPSNTRWSADSVKLIFVTAAAFSFPGQKSHRLVICLQLFWAEKHNVNETYHHCPQQAQQPCYLYQQLRCQTDKRHEYEPSVQIQRIPSLGNRGGVRAEATCGGLMIAQKWSTGYIPRFEILHKHEPLKCQNIEFHERQGSLDNNYKQADITYLKVPPWNSLGASFPALAFSASCLTWVIRNGENMTYNNWKFKFS